MEKRPLAVYGYELTTPKFRNKKYDMDRFDFELLYYYFNRIINEIPLHERAFRHKNKMINLISFESSEYDNYYKGIFTTARFGKKQEILDVINQTSAGIKKRDHGVKNEVLFFVDKETGLFLLEKDSEQVASAAIIRKFIAYHSGLIKEYRHAFNDIHSPTKIHKSNFLKISSLPKRSFFDEIKEFSRIKDAYYYLDIKEIDSKNNEASNLMYLYDAAKENGMIGVTRVKVSLENTVRKGSVQGIESYFKKLFESQHFDGLGVRGTLESGRHKNIKLENIQRVFDINVRYNDNGIPLRSDIAKEMANIMLKDNPLRHKRKIKQYEGVVYVGYEKEERKI